MKSVSRMRFNKSEVSALASQPSHKFEKEGVLFVKERQEGFFRRTEISLERWCRLRGNLLFYFKSRDHWSEPAGVIVVEDCNVDIEDNAAESTFGILLTFSGGHQQHLATYTEYERDAWTAALRSASHRNMKSHLENLRQRLKAKICGNPELAASLSAPEVILSAGPDGGGGGDGGKSSVATKGHSGSGRMAGAPHLQSSVIDPSEPPLLEMALACDNLLCDALGRAPSARLVVHVRNPPEILWKRSGQTEIAEKSSNPAYLRTMTFRASEGVGDRTEIRVTAHDFRERLTATATQLGKTQITLEQLKKEGRVRLKLESPNPEGRNAGFVTLTSWTFEVKLPGSTDSTPYHSNSHKNKHINGSAAEHHLTQQGHTHLAKSLSGSGKHRRSQSLPPDTHHAARTPGHRSLAMICANPVVKTYRFHSGLAGDINVQELMAESKLSFTFPQQLLSLWICEEKELVHEIAGLGELKSPWHTCQMMWLQNHLNLINIYSQALENLDTNRTSANLNFRKSTSKDDKTFEFVPTNLHLQRMWVENESLRKSGFYDVITHGAFTAMAQKSPGLIKMLKELKAPQKDSTAWCSQSDRLQMAEDTLNAVRRVRKEVVDCMRVLMKRGRERTAEGMFPLVEEMLRKTKCLCALLDQNLVEEAFGFLEDNRITVRPERDEFSESVAEFMQRNRLKIDLPLFHLRPNQGGVAALGGAAGLSLQTPCTEFLSKELRTPDVDPNSLGGGEFWRTYSAYTSGYQSVDRLSDIDEFEESFKYLSVVDKTKHYYTLCKTIVTPVDTPLGTPGPSPKSSLKKETEDEGIGRDEVISVVENNSLPNSPVKICIDEEQDDFDLQQDASVIAQEVIDEIMEESDEEVEMPEEEVAAPDEIIEDCDADGDMPVLAIIEQEHGDNDGCLQDELCDALEKEAEEKEEAVEAVDELVENKVEGLETEEEEEKKTKKADQGLTSDSPSGLHYRAGDEPEPIDLTHLNIEAAMMCLASKVRMLSGKADSPTLSSRTFRFKELDAQRRLKNEMGMTKSASHESAFKIPDVPRPMAENPGDIEDWSAELRPSMRKLRQGMDSLCKTARLVCSVLRLQQSKQAIQLSYDIKYRRDVCFSQALTSLITALMTKFWASEPDPTFLHLCAKLGPLVMFESLVSLYGEDVAIFNDMLVAVEDLRNVEFTLILVDKRAKSAMGKAKTKVPKKNAGMPILPYHSFPLPRVTGSRSSLKVMLPVPDYVYTMLPLEQITRLTFCVTPLLFNIGINEKASLAGSLGANGPQEKNNVDNFKMLSEYHRRFKKLDLPQPPAPSNGRNKRFSMQSNEPEIEDLLSILKGEVNNKKNKNVDVLHLSSIIVRRMSGIRFQNCKSGKDRTGMAATLEQVQILSREYDLAEHEYQKALDVMRSEGTRRENVFKNIHDRRYAFNALQLATFPYQYRPPVGTYGSKQT